MPEKSITRINVSNFGVSIIGLKELLEEIAESHGDKSDQEVAQLMLERLGAVNYIPSKARQDYGRAFVRELRKFMGQPFTEEAPRGLDVKVLGIGCSQCRALTQTVMEVLTELKLAANVDHVTDINEIARYPVMGSPALIINGKPVAVGSVPPRNKIRKWLLEADAAAGAQAG
ncbi:MAG: thioredoxin family protein [Syntrophobacteraceae bacterium]|jgi:hypothetical protein|nr:thioredoxin family protein [Syntrophobacteraceae bacterium]